MGDGFLWKLDSKFKIPTDIYKTSESNVINAHENKKDLERFYVENMGIKEWNKVDINAATTNVAH